MQCNSLSIKVSGGTVSGNIYGGGKGIDITTADKPSIYAITSDGEIKLIDWMKTTDNTAVPVTFGKTGYQGFAATSSSISITLDGGTINGSIYGGGALGVIDGDSIQIITDGGVVLGSVYGGGKGVTGDIECGSVDCSTISISLSGTEVFGDIYGGGALSNCSVPSISIRINSGKVEGNVFGGGMGSLSSEVAGSIDISSSISITVLSGEICNNVYGGGALGKVTGDGSSNIGITLSGGTIGGSVYGGGMGSEGNLTLGKITKTSIGISMSSGTVTGSVYGGGAISVVSIPNNNIVISISGGDIGGLFGAGMGVSTLPDSGKVEANTITVNLSGGSVADSVYGGGELGDVRCPSITTVVGSGHDHNVYGGGKNADVYGSTIVWILTNASIIGSVYGGGEQGRIVGETDDATTLYVYGKISGDVFAGGLGVQGSNLNMVTGTRTAYIGYDGVSVTSTPSIGGSVYGGSSVQNDKGDARIIIGTANISISVYGGGFLGQTDGDTEIVVGVPGAIPADSDIKYIRVGFGIYGGGNVGSFAISSSADKVTVTGTTEITVTGTYDYETGDVGDLRILTDHLVGTGNAGKVGYSCISIENASLGYDDSTSTRSGESNQYTREDLSMYSIQRCSILDISGSWIFLQGEYDGESASVTSKRALRNIDTITVNNSDIHLGSSSEGIREISFGDPWYEDAEVSRICIYNGAILHVGTVFGEAILDSDDDSYYGAYVMLDDPNSTAVFWRIGSDGTPVYIPHDPTDRKSTTTKGTLVKIYQKANYNSSNGDNMWYLGGAMVLDETVSYASGTVKTDFTLPLVSDSGEYLRYIGFSYDPPSWTFENNYLQKWVGTGTSEAVTINLITGEGTFHICYNGIKPIWSNGQDNDLIVSIDCGTVDAPYGTILQVTLHFLEQRASGNLILPVKYIDINLNIVFVSDPSRNITYIDAVPDETSYSGESDSSLRTESGTVQDVYIKISEISGNLGGSLYISSVRATDNSYGWINIGNSLQFNLSNGESRYVYLNTLGGVRDGAILYEYICSKDATIPDDATVKLNICYGDPSSPMKIEEKTISIKKADYVTTVQIYYMQYTNSGVICVQDEEGTTLYTEQKIPYGGTVVLPEPKCISGDIKPVFRGWKVISIEHDADGNTILKSVLENFDPNQKLMPHTNTDLYVVAYYSFNAVKLDPSGGEIDITVISDLGNQAVINLDSLNCVKTGYTLLYWTDGQNRYTESYMYYSNNCVVTLTAVWARTFASWTDDSEYGEILVVSERDLVEYNGSTYYELRNINVDRMFYLGALGPCGLSYYSLLNDGGCILTDDNRLLLASDGTVCGDRVLTVHLEYIGQLKMSVTETIPIYSGLIITLNVTVLDDVLPV